MKTSLEGRSAMDPVWGNSQSSGNDDHDYCGGSQPVDRALPDASNVAGSSGQVGGFCEGDVSEDLSPFTDARDVLENRRRLLAEIRSCFRVLSIHSRLSGNESPRTRRMNSQASSRQSLHSLAMESSADSSRPGSSNDLAGADLVQDCLIYNQLMASSLIPPCAGGGTPPLSRQNGSEITEPNSESIHQQYMVNPTLNVKHNEELSKSDVMKLVEWLYRDHPGAVWRAASREAMAEQANSNSLIYGEVSFVAFAKLMERYSPKKYSSASTSEPERGGENVGFNFYDLGCGGGRCVFMASLLNTNCVKSCGVEIVPGMHQMNQILLRLYTLEIQPYLHPRKQSQQLQFLLGDFNEMDWSDADVIFTNATCFDDPIFFMFEDKAAKVLKPGSIVISVARFFRNREIWELLEEQERRMSWAPAMVYVYKKRTTPAKLED